MYAYRIITQTTSKEEYCYNSKNNQNEIDHIQLANLDIWVLSKKLPHVLTRKKKEYSI